jgi:hypothetical protein
MRTRAARVLGWIGEHPVPAATIAGGVTYAVVRVSLARFYGRFGVEPEEVGLGYADVLVRTVFGLALTYVLLFVAGFLVLAMLVGIAGKGGPLARYEDRAAQWAGPAFIAWLIVVLPVLLVLLPFRAEALADDIVAGTAVRPFRLEEYRGDLSLGNPFGIRAEFVTVEALDGTVPPLLKNCDCTLIYLGRSSGIAVLYDVTHRRTLRLPDAELVIIRES